jgi:hypothetical protein
MACTLLGILWMYLSISGIARASCHKSTLPLIKQANNGSVQALKRCSREFSDQQMTSDDAGPSYLENADKYEYDTLAIGRLIAR